jgi:glycerol-3-phosphate O-acyltransferase/dihydroxyacetone phosphate acyltransferase
MWFSLRWLEDALSSLRAAVALASMLAIGPLRLSELREQRNKLHERVVQAAVERADLPEDVKAFLERERRKEERGGRVGRLGYFSIRRRRKKDYNEVMRLWDKTEFA